LPAFDDLDAEDFAEDDFEAFAELFDLASIAFEPALADFDDESLDLASIGPSSRCLE